MFTIKKLVQKNPEALDPGNSRNFLEKLENSWKSEKLQVTTYHIKVFGMLAHHVDTLNFRNSEKFLKVADKFW